MTKPITYCGWDSPPTEQLPGVRSFAQQNPVCRGVDGYAVQAVRRGQPNNLLNLLTREVWRTEDFAGAQAGGRWLWSRGLNPSGDPVKWDDEARWKTIESKFVELSQLALRHDMRGVLIDLEHHGAGPCLWQAQKSSDWSQAYNRGLQLADRMRNRTFGFHKALSFLADLLPLPGGGVLEKRPPTLESHKYGLLSKFIAGLSSYHTVVDFCATNQARTPEHVFEEHATLRNLPNLLQQDYSRVKFGSSLYLDRFLTKVDEDKRPIIRCPQNSFRAMVDAYWRASEDDMLLYGEWGRLCEPNASIHGAPLDYRHWKERIPGFSDQLESVTEPERFARETDGQSVLGSAWTWWRPKGSTATFSGMSVIGQGSPSFFQEIEVSPGEAFAARGHIQSTATAWLGCWWRDAAGTRIDPLTTRRFYAQTDGIASGVAVAPPGAVKLVVTLAVDHDSENDRTVFKDAKVCRVGT